MEGDLPWGLLAAGSGIAATLALFRIPVMPVAIGIYLRFGLNAAIFAGGLLRWLVERQTGGRAANEDRGTLLSAGLIAGEGLCGILLAILALL